MSSHEDDTARARRLEEVLVPAWQSPYGEHVPSIVFYELARVITDPAEVLLTDLLVPGDQRIEHSGQVTVLASYGIIELAWTRKAHEPQTLDLSLEIRCWPHDFAIRSTLDDYQASIDQVPANSFALLSGDTVMLTLPSRDLRKQRSTYLSALTRLLASRT